MGLLPVARDVDAAGHPDLVMGLDVVEDKLMEINVFSPGGLVGAGKLNKMNFMDLIVDALERKVEIIAHDPTRFNNGEIATM